jgi:3',5'-cyclic AMP phosphodiesterase CpdA
VIDDYPVRIVAVHSVVPGRIEGIVRDEQLAWLDRTLAEKPTTPTLVMMHHPPFATGLQHFDVVGMTDIAGSSA